MNDIPFFQGKYRWLSNFWPCTILLDGEPYSTVEHAYQAAKTEIIIERIRIRMVSSPGLAKKLGRKVTISFDWDKRKLDVMRFLLIQKFEDKELRDKLIETGDTILIEGNYWGDKYWGVCNYEGENNLGKLLMEIRSNIMKEEENKNDS